MSLLFVWLLNALSLLVVDRILSGMQISSLYSALVAALVLGLVNISIRPILLLLTLPITLITLGLFTFVINALMLLLASTIVKGFVIDGFGTAFGAAVLLWLISLVIDWFRYRRYE